MADRELLRSLFAGLRILDSMIDKPLPLASAADKQLALRLIRKMRGQVWNARLAPPAIPVNEGKAGDDGGAIPDGGHDA